MTSTSLTRVLRSSKQLASPGQRCAWLRLPGALLLGVLLLAVGCQKDPSSIGVGLPSGQTNTGAYLIDTLTIRASTVLRDSVVTSGSDYLLVGRYADPLFGTLTAKSFFRLTGAFQPDPAFVYDSLTLVLKPDAYRYGDTTKTQALFEVHRLVDQLSDINPLFAAPRLTPVNYDSTTLLNKGGVAPKLRARPRAAALRLPLSDAFGQDLLAKAQAGKLATQDDFTAYLPGLALTAAATDNAAIVRMSVSAAESALILYYHDPTNPTVVLSTSFNPTARHFYQLKANRSTAGVPNLPRKASLQTVSSTLTGEQTFVEGVLGLQTLLEFPYLTDVQLFGQNITVTSATALTAIVPSSSLTPFVPAPPNLILNYTDGANHPQGVYYAGQGGGPQQPPIGIPYLSGISAQTNLEQGIYSWPMADYCQNVINRRIPNTGLLLSSITPTLPNRVVLGGPRNRENKLTLRLYFITAD